jgi:hypothetical protein
LRDEGGFHEDFLALDAERELERLVVLELLESGLESESEEAEAELELSESELSELELELELELESDDDASSSLLGESTTVASRSSQACLLRFARKEAS